MDILATPYPWLLSESPTVTPQLMAEMGERSRQLWRWSGISSAIAAGLLLTGSPLHARTFPAAGTAYVTPPSGYNVDIRNGPSTGFPAVNTLAPGTAITLTGRYQNGWAQLTDGTWVAGNLINSQPVVGHVSGAAIAYIAPPPGYNVNIRSGPGIGFPAVNTLAPGTAITLTGRYQNGWAQLTDGTWVAGNLIRVGQPVTQPAPFVEQPAVLRVGSQGTAVGDLQRRLQVLGYLPTNFVPDGYFGASTEQAVREFQQRNRLVVDGILGPQTRSVIYSDCAIASPPPPSAPFTEEPPSTPDPGTPPTNGGESAPDSGASGPPQQAQIQTDTGMESLVFAGPGTEYELLGFLPDGTLVTLTGNSQGGWAELESGGWVYEDWLNLNP